MAYERRGSRQYYYQSVRVPGGVRKRYFGGGSAGAAAAEQAARESRRRQQRRIEREQRIAALREHMADIAAADRELEAWLHALLIAAGNYYHHGLWRPRHYVRHRSGRHR
jgi:hypothetical protein